MREPQTGSLNVLHFDAQHPVTVALPHLEQSVFHESGGDRNVFSVQGQGDYLSRHALLGEPHLYVVTHHGEFVASLMLLKRRMAGQVCWQIDDARFAPKKNGKLMLQCVGLFRKVFRETVAQDPFFFAIIAAQGNRSDRILLQFYRLAMGAPFSEIATLCDFTLSHREFAEAVPVIEKHRGAITGYLSLAGLRDFLVNHEQQSPSLQVQYGPLAICNASQDASCTYSLLSPQGDAMTQALQALGFSPFIKLRIFGRQLTLDPKWFLGQDV